jgi:copper chaperone NosL
MDDTTGERERDRIDLCKKHNREHDDTRPSGTTPRSSGITRRQVVQVGGAVAVAGFAGCLGGGGGDGDVPDPVSLSGSMSCDVCGMVIEKHPGPNGQIFFESNEPPHAPPARFDSLKQCLFPYLFERRAEGWTESAVYVTDYSAVEYSVSSEGNTQVVSSYTTPETFADATELHFVVGSSVEGAMGPDFVPFSVRTDADEFADEYGGDVFGFDDIDEAAVGR